MPLDVEVGQHKPGIPGEEWVAMPTVTIRHATWCAPLQGTIEPRLREEGVEPALVDVDRARARPGPARGLPAKPSQMTAILRCRGHP